MRRTLGWCVVVTMSLMSGVTAQTPPQKPGPEHKRLGYFVGKWTSTGDMKASPFGPAGKITGTDTCDWFEGGFTVVCHSQGTSPAGPTKGIGIMGYDAEGKVYTYYGVDNTAMVMSSVPKGAIQGDTWTFNDAGTMGGQPYKSRFVLKTASPTSYAFSWEWAGADGKWTTILSGISTKKS